MTNYNSSRKPVYEQHDEGFGAIQVIPVDPERDAALIHGWVTQERARFWGMRDMSVGDVHKIYAHMDTLTTHHAFLLHRNSEPVALFQTYEPAEDRISLCYDVEPGDIGNHRLIAPIGDGRAPEPGFTGRIFDAIDNYIFADQTWRRIVAEPDIRNVKAINRLLRRGFILGPEILLPEVNLPEVYLPEKRAYLCFRQVR